MKENKILKLVVVWILSLLGFVYSAWAINYEYKKNYMVVQDSVFFGKLNLDALRARK